MIEEENELFTKLYLPMLAGLIALFFYALLIVLVHPEIGFFDVAALPAVWFLVLVCCISLITVRKVDGLITAGVAGFVTPIIHNLITICFASDNVLSVDNVSRVIEFFCRLETWIDPFLLSLMAMGGYALIYYRLYGRS